MKKLLVALFVAIASFGVHAGNAFGSISISSPNAYLHIQSSPRVYRAPVYNAPRYNRHYYNRVSPQHHGNRYYAPSRYVPNVIHVYNPNNPYNTEIRVLPNCAHRCR